MTPRNQEEQIGKAETGIGKPGRERMAFKVIDGEQRLARRERQALACEERDHHSAYEAGTRGRSNRIHVANRHSGLVQYLLNQAGQNLDMGPGCDFRDDAAIWLMRSVLPDDRLRQNSAVRGHECGRAVVATTFKAKYHSHFAPGPLPQGAALH